MPSPSSAGQAAYDGGGPAPPLRKWSSGRLLGRLDSGADFAAASADWRTPRFPAKVAVTAASGGASPAAGCGAGCGWPAASLLFGDGACSLFLAPGVDHDVCGCFLNPGRAAAPQRTWSLHSDHDAVVSGLFVARHVFPSPPAAVRSDDDTVSQMSTARSSSSSWCSDPEQASQNARLEKPGSGLPLPRHGGDSPCRLVDPGPGFLAAAPAARPEEVRGDEEVPRFPSVVDSEFLFEAVQRQQSNAMESSAMESCAMGSSAMESSAMESQAGAQSTSVVVTECPTDTEVEAPVADLRKRFEELEGQDGRRLGEDSEIVRCPSEKEDTSTDSAFAELERSLADTEDNPVPTELTGQALRDFVAEALSPIDFAHQSLDASQADASVDFTTCVELPTVTAMPLLAAGANSGGPRMGRPTSGQRSPPRQASPRGRSVSPKATSRQPPRRSASTGKLLSAEQFEENILGLCAAASQDDNQVHRAAVWLAISQLVEVARDGRPELQEQVARAWERLAYEDADYKAKVAESGAIALLIEFLSVDGACSTHAAGALAGLAMHCPMNRSMIAGAGAITKLLGFLQRADLPLMPGTPEAAAVRALLHLSRNSSQNKVSIVQGGGIPMLVHHLEQGTPETGFEVAELLGSLAANHPMHEESVCRSLAIAGLDGIALNAVEEPVTLHIYDVSGDARVQLVNDLFRPVGTGAFHAGVEVYGHEWSFGARQERGTGVFRCEPRRNAAHTYREAVPMDVTTLSKREVEEVMLRLEKKWSGRDYNLLSRNCCHFCDELCEELGVGPTPPWITNLAVTGATLVSGVRTAVAAGRETAQAVREVAREMDERYQIWGTAEAAVRDIVNLAQRALPPDERMDLTAAELVPVQAQASGIGGIARGLLSGVSQHLWPHTPDDGTSVDVVLECLYSSSLDVDTLPQGQCCFSQKITSGSSWAVGPRHQPDVFCQVLPDLAVLPQHHRNQSFFEISWQPPCLYLRKPSEETPISIYGSPVKKPTYVLLSRAEIELCGEEGGEPFLAFRMLRYSEQERDADPGALARGRRAQRVSRPRSCRHADVTASP